MPANGSLNFYSNFMQYRQLGSSALTISVIGFGCMSLEPEQAVTNSLLHEAVASGINYFDTADLYQQGFNEEMVGKALKGKRKNVVIATKAGNQLKPGGDGWEWNPRKEYILSAVDKSLRRLQTDYIDLYQLHGGTIDDPIDDTIAAFEQLVQQGKIRYYGISSIRPNVIREYVKRSNIVSVMMQYGLLDRRPEEECLALLQQNNIGVLARGSLAKGLLAGKTPAAFLTYTAAEVSKMAGAVARHSSIDRSPAATAIQYVLGNPALTSAITGIRTIEQLRELVQVSGASGLTPAERTMLQETLPANLYTEHR